MNNFYISLILLITFLSPNICQSEMVSTNYRLVSEPIGVSGAWVESNQFYLYSTIGMPPVVSENPINTPAGYSLQTSVDTSLVYLDPLFATTSVLSLHTGWNLVSSVINVAASQSFGNAKTFLSVWKWVDNKWAVYLPGGDGGSSYATSKGFDLLTAIAPGEGFWVNSSKNETVNIVGTATPPQPPLNDNMFKMAGWHLVGLMSGEPLLVDGLSVSIKDKVVSLWKWSNGTWAVYLPNEATPGAYALSKGFIVLDTINPSEGFWVNVQ